MVVRRSLITVVLAVLLAIGAYGLRAQTLQNVEPGFRQIDGSLINSILARVNGGTTNATYYFTGAPAATDQAFFVATRAYLVIGISEVHSAAAGGASVLQVVKDTGTTAPGAGTDLLTGTGFDLNGTANTVQVGALAASIATLTLAAGDRLSVDYANAIQSSAGVVVTVALQPL